MSLKVILGPTLLLIEINGLSSSIENISCHYTDDFTQHRIVPHASPRQAVAAFLSVTWRTKTTSHLSTLNMCFSARETHNKFIPP